MDKKKILIVGAAFYPSNSPRSFRATELAKEFARQGHAVTVYFPTRDYDYSSFEDQYHVRIKDLGNLRFKKIEIKGGKLERAFRRSLKRSLQLLFEYPNLEYRRKVKNKIKHEKDYDMLISIAAPHPIHWGIAAIWNKTNKIAKTWIADCGDPFMGNEADTFKKMFYFKYFEKSFCKKADFIVVPVQSAKNAYYPEFRDKIRVIPQGFDFSTVKLASYEKKGKKPVFAFAGSILPYIDSGPRFFKYLLNLKEDFLFILYVRDLGWAEKFIEQLKDRVIINNYVPREQLIYELSQVDFLVNFMYKTDVQKSSKLIDYMLTKRPILNVTPVSDLDILNEFFNNDFTHKLNTDEVDDYNIINISKQFFSLLSEEKNSK